MAANLHPDLKSIQSYLNRAAELDSREPLMAYYCRLCAVKTGMTLVTPSNKAATQPFLLDLMGSLEQMKQEFTADGGTLPNDETGREYVEAFAYRIFLQADNEDRAGNANDKTAKKFLFASTFFDVVKVFGPMSQEVIEKQRYAKWKASDILKALKEGRKPTPGPPGGDPNLPPNIGDGAPPPTANVSNVVMPKTNLPAKVASQSPNVNYIDHTGRGGGGGGRGGANDDDNDDDAGLMYDPEMIASVQKLCKFASSALNYEDLPTAIDNLEKALKMLKAAARH